METESKYSQMSSNRKVYCMLSAAPILLEALEILVDHAQEKFPHFESERGQVDIKRALNAIMIARELK